MCTSQKPFMLWLTCENRLQAPVFWSTSEFQELKGSQMEDMVAHDISETRREWDMVQKLIVSHSDVFCRECFNFDTYRWAAWNVHSRALTLRGVKYLIPLADMVNYQPLPDDGAQNRNHQDLFLKYHRITLNPHDQGTGIAEIFADRDFAVGSMIVESYGDNPNNMYLRYFGFVPLANPTDCRTIRFSLQHAKGAREASAAALEQANLPTHVQHCFRLGEPVPSHVLRFLRILHASAHDAARAKTSAHLELSLHNEKAVYKTIVAECDALLAAFATTLEEDETWLAETGPPAASAAREMLNKRHAVLARVRYVFVAARERETCVLQRECERHVCVAARVECER